MSTAARHLPYVAPESLAERQSTVDIPGSKSITIRAMACSMLLPTTTRIIGALDSDDIDDGLNVLEAWGATVSESYENNVRVLAVTGTRNPKRAVMDVHLTGSASWSRFLIGISAMWSYVRQQPITVSITADNLLAHRPMSDPQFEQILRYLGTSPEGSWEIDPATSKIVFNMDGSKSAMSPEKGSPIWLGLDSLDKKEFISSQFASSFLLSSLVTDNGIGVLLPDEFPSRKYVDMTLETLKAFGCEMETETGYHTVVSPPAIGSSPPEYVIEPDASTASYALAAGALISGMRLTVPRLCDKSSIQGDAQGIVSLLKKAGANINSDPTSGISVSAPKDCLKGLEMDMSQCQDLGQTAAVLALFANTTSRLTGLCQTRRKESDRIADTADELNALASRMCEATDVRYEPIAQYDDDSLSVSPLGQDLIEVFSHSGTKIQLDSHGDHRMAMALGLIGLRIPGVEIKNAACVTKTWPAYWEEMASVCS